MKPAREHIFGNREARREAQMRSAVGPQSACSGHQGAHVAEHCRRPRSSGQTRRREMGTAGRPVEQVDAQVPLHGAQAHAGGWLGHAVRGGGGTDRAQFTDADQQVEGGHVRVGLGQGHQHRLEPERCPQARGLAFPNRTRDE